MGGWYALLLAGVCEVAWALGLKCSDGFTQVWPSLGTAAAIAANFLLLSHSLRSIPFGTAYAIWTGTGAAGSILVGMFLFGESAGVFRFTCLTLIVLGTLGLRLVTPN
jgi:quaternary ammonium compound-resistance protein SugE